MGNIDVLLWVIVLRILFAETRVLVPPAGYGEVVEGEALKLVVGLHGQRLSEPGFRVDKIALEEVGGSQVENEGFLVGDGNFFPLGVTEQGLSEDDSLREVRLHEMDKEVIVLLVDERVGGLEIEGDLDDLF